MPHHKPLPSREELLEHLRYDPETGLFWWTKRGRRRTLSKPAGYKAFRRKNGEPNNIEIRLNHELWMAHRLAWRIMTGSDPGDLTIDHINRNPFDNRWANLRLADYSLQGRNKGCRNQYGHKGIWFDPCQGKWRAAVWIDGKTKYLGRYSSKAEAVAVAAPYHIQ